MENEINHNRRTSSSSNGREINSFQQDLDSIAILRSYFARIYKSSYHCIYHFIERGDIESARYLAYTIKNSAEMILEEKLTEAVGDVAKVLEGKEKPTDAQLFALEGEFMRVINDIEKEKTESSEVVEFLEVDEALAVLDALVPLLTTQNVACLDSLDMLRKIPQSAELCHQVESYNFSDALKLLVKLRKDLSATLITTGPHDMCTTLLL
ncbi:MAG: hypothetical protein FWC20_10235 [Oscillospiraceae bacterium]|nr:hypothetical protein [Oscillospiraceae bacterium]MCL2279766.1 hypothetical protein [Oscillospiraceae bacterium]